MPARTLPPEQVLDLLAATPTRLAALTTGLAPEQLRTGPADGEWSVSEVLAHLRACADVWGTCITTLLEQDSPTLRAVDPRRWLQGTDYLDLDFAPSLRSFTAQREDLLAALLPLPPDGWSRSGTVTGAGRPLVRTVLSYASRLAVHERQHVGQVDRTVRALAAGG